MVARKQDKWQPGMPVPHDWRDEYPQLAKLQHSSPGLMGMLWGGPVNPNVTVAPKGGAARKVEVPVDRGVIIPSATNPETGERELAPSKLGIAATKAARGVGGFLTKPMYSQETWGGLANAVKPVASAVYDSGKKAFTAPLRAIRGEIEPEDYLKEGWEFVGNVAGYGGALAGIPAIARHAPLGAAAGMFVGAKGAQQLAKGGQKIGTKGGKPVFSEPDTRLRDAMRTARKLDEDGVPRDEIWSVTGQMLADTPYAGVFKGVDGKWRAELDDSLMKPKFKTPQQEQNISLAKIQNSKSRNRWPLGPHGLKLLDEGTAQGELFTKGHGSIGKHAPQTRGGFLDYPELYAIYPGMKKGKMSYLDDAKPNEGGYYRPFQDETYLNPFPGSVPVKSIAAHETQHGVQAREQFASGGGDFVKNITNTQATFANMAPDRAKLIAEETDPARKLAMLKAEQRRTAMVEKAGKARDEAFEEAEPLVERAIDHRYGTLLPVEHKDALVALDQEKVNAVRRAAANRALYQREAGEVEARNVENRLNMDMEQRRAMPPYKTYDVPEDKQFVSNTTRINPLGLGGAQFKRIGDNVPEVPLNAGGNARAMQVLPQQGRPLPPGASGSYDATANQPFLWKGKNPNELSPEDLEEMGAAFGVSRLGPLSKPQVMDYADGSGTFSIPGGTEGKFTYADMLEMKANPINAELVDEATHAKLQQKITRSLMPDDGMVSDAQVWNGLVFGATSPNNPLTPNQMAMSRLRVNSMEDLDRIADMTPWGIDDMGKVSAEQRKKVNDAIAAKFGLQAAEKGGIGVRGTADYSRVSDMAKLFRKNPEFYRRKGEETWPQFVERVVTQTPGLSAKTGSFGVVWQDPAEAAISAIDRHMVNAFERQGGKIFTPEKRKAFENRVLKLYNKKRAKAGKPQYKSISEMNDGDVGYELLQEMGKSIKGDFRMADGSLNKRMPGHLSGEKWIVEPDQFVMLGDNYKKALEVNAQKAREHGLGLFESQWHVWDRQRRRLEPHENMFPGLEQLPRPSLDQLRVADKAHLRTGHKNYSKQYEANGIDYRLRPTKPIENAADLTYFTNAPTAAPLGLAPANRRNERR